MSNWAKYLKVMENDGKAAAWNFAKKNFAKTSPDYISAQKFHAPTAKNRIESVKRQNAIKSVSKKEIFENCQFAGLPKV